MWDEPNACLVITTLLTTYVGIEIWIPQVESAGYTKPDWKYIKLDWIKSQDRKYTELVSYSIFDNGKVYQSLISSYQKSDIELKVVYKFASYSYNNWSSAVVKPSHLL